MNVAALGGAPRVAFLGSPELALHFPSRCTWATARFIAAEEGRWSAAVDEAVALGPDVAVVADPAAMPADELARLPGRKIGMVTRPPSPAELAALAAAATGAAGFDAYTWFEDPPPEANALPVVQVLPLPVDVERCLAAPRLEERRVIVPAWARPGRAWLAQLRSCADVAEIPLSADPAEWPRLLASGGALVHWSHATLGRLDPLPLLALGQGLLVVASRPFPAAWGVEQDDEYLVRADEAALVRAVEDAARTPEPTRAVRVRAWQRVRESFSADAAFHRLVHDALRFDLASPAATVLRRGAARGASTARAAQRSVGDVRRGA
jgi:hypothetical protein